MPWKKSELSSWCRFASHLHMNAFKQIIGVPVEVARGSGKRERRSWSRSMACPVYDDYRQMLDDQDIDVVDICVPNILHTDYVDAGGREALFARNPYGCVWPQLTGIRKVGLMPKVEMPVSWQNANRIVEVFERNNGKSATPKTISMLSVVRRSACSNKAEAPFWS